MNIELIVNGKLETYVLGEPMPPWLNLLWACRRQHEISRNAGTSAISLFQHHRHVTKLATLGNESHWVVYVALFHDIAEIFTGDIPSCCKNKKLKALELDAVREFLIWLHPYNPELVALCKNRKEFKKIFDRVKKYDTLAYKNETRELRCKK